MSHQNETESFDRLAPNYEQLRYDPMLKWFGAGTAFFYARKLQLLGEFFEKRGLSTKTMNWLDVGCGRGDLLSGGLHAFGSVAGCDPSREMLRSCTTFPAKLQPTATEIPFPDQSFDLATLVCVLHHVLPAHREALLADVSRVVKPGGWLCIIEHNTLNPVTRLIVARNPIDVDAQLLSAEESRRLAAVSGFAVVCTQNFLYVPERMFRRFQWLETWLANVPLGGQYAVFSQLPESERPSPAE